MVAAKAGYDTLVVDELHSGVARIASLCLLYFHQYYLMLQHCPLVIVVSQTAHLLEPYW